MTSTPHPTTPDNANLMEIISTHTDHEVLTILATKSKRSDIRTAAQLRLAELSAL